MTASGTHEQGIYCYVMTPFAKSGDVDLGVLKDYVEAIIQSGVDGLTCIASTCEGAYLSEQERFDVVKAVCKITDGRVRVNVGAGAISTRESIRRGFNFVNSLPKPSVGFRFDQIDDYSYPKSRQNYTKYKKPPPPLHSLTLTLRIEATINGLSDLDVQVASDHPKVLPQSRSSTYIRGWRLR